jgi:hypothetical protein
VCGKLLGWCGEHGSSRVVKFCLRNKLKDCSWSV